MTLNGRGSMTIFAKVKYQNSEARAMPLGGLKSFMVGDFDGVRARVP